MSSIKRSRARQADASPQPASKKPKTSHKAGLEFLVNEDARTGRKLDAKLTNGVARFKANRVDESQALAAQDSPDEESVQKPSASKNIAWQQDVISISSREESSELEEEDSDDAGEGPAATHAEEDKKAFTNGPASGRAAEGRDQEEMEDGETTHEPTFGDLLQARHPDPIDMQRALHSRVANGDMVSTGSRQLIQPPTAGSLGTVLTQALKTNDKDLLESCFAIVDVNAIRATIQRQQSQQIASLLERIAERIHKRPGRAGRLMIWIQWSLVTHGGYLANQPELMKKLKALAQVTRERANGLQPLLHLKGKLDLLSAQLEARRSMQAASRVANADDMDDEQEVLYIEGQAADWSSDEEAADRGASNRTKKLLQAMDEASDAEFGKDDDLPNGYINGIEEDASDEEQDDRLLDEEAEEVSDEESSSNEEADSDASSVDDDESSSDSEDEEVGTVKQPKPQSLNRKR